MFGSLGQYATFNDTSYSQGSNAVIGDYATYNDTSYDYVGTVGNHATFNQSAGAFTTRSAPSPPTTIRVPASLAARSAAGPSGTARATTRAPPAPAFTRAAPAPPQARGLAWSSAPPGPISARAAESRVPLLYTGTEPTPPSGVAPSPVDWLIDLLLPSAADVLDGVVYDAGAEAGSRRSGTALAGGRPLRHRRRRHDRHMPRPRGRRRALRRACGRLRDRHGDAAQHRRFSRIHARRLPGPARGTLWPGQRHAGHRQRTCRSAADCRRPEAHTLVGRPGSRERHGPAGRQDGFHIVPGGLDAIAVGAGPGPAATFAAMLVQLWRRFFKRAVLDHGAGTLTTYADDGTTVTTTQAVSETATVETLGPAS